MKPIMTAESTTATPARGFASRRSWSHSSPRPITPSSPTGLRRDLRPPRELLSWGDFSALVAHGPGSPQGQGGTAGAVGRGRGQEGPDHAAAAAGNARVQLMPKRETMASGLLFQPFLGKKQL